MGVVFPGTGRLTPAGQRQRRLPVAAHALRVRAVEREAGEEFGRHAAALAGAERRAGSAGAACGGGTEAGEEWRVTPYSGEPARRPDGSGMECLVDRKRAG